MVISFWVSTSSENAHLQYCWKWYKFCISWDYYYVKKLLYTKLLVVIVDSKQGEQNAEWSKRMKYYFTYVKLLKRITQSFWDI